jgi:hypothetical protein
MSPYVILPAHPGGSGKLVPLHIGWGGARRIDVHWAYGCPSSQPFEPVIWSRLIQTPKEPVSPEAARYLPSIDFSESDHSRMQEPMDKSSEGSLTSEEDSELDSYVNIANVLSVMHSRARVVLRNGGLECPSDIRSFVNQSLIRSVRDRAQRRCEYCHMPESGYASSFHADHILARQHGGESGLENLALATIQVLAIDDPGFRAVRVGHWDEGIRDWD